MGKNSKTSRSSKRKQQKKPEFEIDVPNPPTPAQLSSAAEKARQLFAAEPTLLELHMPCLVVGDLHGNYADLQHVLMLPHMQQCGTAGIHRFLFLGDYVDRGVHSTQLLYRLLLLKLEMPRQFNMLRGNHETSLINNAYGFRDELKTLYGDEATQLWAVCNHMFAFMPLAALLDNRVLCMHGGVSERLNTLDDIRNLKRPIAELSQSPLAADLLWSDPNLRTAGPSPKGPRFQPNKVRNVSVVFNEDAADELCARLGISMIVRAHQVRLNGHSFFNKRRVVTIFSATGYNEKKNSKAAVLVLKRPLSARLIIFAPCRAAEVGQQPLIDAYREMGTEQLDIDSGNNTDKSLCDTKIPEEKSDEDDDDDDRLAHPA